jgi:hypothetical protein
VGAEPAPGRTMVVSLVEEVPLRSVRNEFGTTQTLAPNRPGLMEARDIEPVFIEPREPGCVSCECLVVGPIGVEPR